MRRRYDSPWVHSDNVWAGCSSLWGSLKLASNWSWSTYSFLSSSLWRRSISTIQFRSCWRVSVSGMVAGGGLESSKRVSHRRLDCVLTMGAKERDNERPQDMFYHSLSVGAKCTYQNLKMTHVRVDVTKVGFQTSHVRLRVTFVRRTREGTYKIKDSDAQVSIWVRRVNEKVCIWEHVRARKWKVCVVVLREYEWTWYL